MAQRRGHGVARHREDLAGEHVAGDAGQLALACLFAAVWMPDTFILRWTTYLNKIVPLGVRVTCGVLALALAGYLAAAGMSIVFAEEREEPGVIREGVFSMVRHPIYLGELLLYLGLLMISMSLAAAVVWVMVFGFLHYISRYEERLLLTRFGEEYAQYMRKVPMWVPWIRKR